MNDLWEAQGLGALFTYDVLERDFTRRVLRVVGAVATAPVDFADVDECEVLKNDLWMVEGSARYCERWDNGEGASQRPSRANECT